MWIEQSIKNTTEDLQTKNYLYVTSEDFANCYNIEKTVFVFNVPVDETDIKISVSVTLSKKWIKFFKRPCFQHKEPAYSLKLKSSGKPIVANLLSEKSYSQQDRKSEKRCKEVEDFISIFLAVVV